MDIAIIDDTTQVSRFHTDLIEGILVFAGEQLNLPVTTEMSVTLMSNEAIHAYNKQYRGVDKPTDVISFAIEETSDDELGVFDAFSDVDIPKNIGDILVAMPIVATQAADLGHSFERELGFLVVHGFLHLNGYDHMDDGPQEAAMLAKQREILDNYGLTR